MKQFTMLKCKVQLSVFGSPFNIKVYGLCSLLYSEACGLIFFKFLIPSSSPLIAHCVHMFRS